MGWIVLGILLLFVIGRFAGNDGPGKDDFAGNSLDSYFLLEEFIDDESRDRDELKQDQILQEQEEDWFEEEFE